MNIRSFTLMFLLLLTACGFRPMYGESAALAKTKSIYIENIHERDGQFLRNALIDRLYTEGRPANAEYRLKLSNPKATQVDLGIRKDAYATLRQKTISVTMELFEQGKEKPVMSRTFNTSATFNLLDSQVATLVSERNLTENILNNQADEIVTHLNLYFYNK